MTKVSKIIYTILAIIIAVAGSVVGIVLADWFDKNVPDYTNTFSTGAYTEAILVNEDGTITFNKADSDIYSYSGSTYFGEEDKNLDWTGEKQHIEFNLDLSCLEENDITVFVLGFNEQLTVGYDHVDEIRFSIAKNSDEYIVKECNGVSWSEADLTNALDSELTFTDSNITCQFIIEYNKDTKVLTYEIKLNDIEVVNSSREITTFEINEGSTQEIVGLRYLWNALTTKAGIILDNLIIW